MHDMQRIEPATPNIAAERVTEISRERNSIPWDPLDHLDSAQLSKLELHGVRVSLEIHAHAQWTGGQGESHVGAIYLGANDLDLARRLRQ